MGWSLFLFTDAQDMMAPGIYDLPILCRLFLLLPLLQVFLSLFEPNGVIDDDVDETDQGQEGESPCEAGEDKVGCAVHHINVRHPRD